MGSLTVRLKPGRDKATRGRHPWLFSGAIASSKGDTKAPIAQVLAHDGSVLGSGFHSPGAQLRVRLLASPEESIGRALFEERLRTAMELRRELLPESTSGYRLLNAEGDGLPGWTVDRFGQVLVSQITSSGLEALRSQAYAALQGLLPGLPILQINELGPRRRENLPVENEVVAGDLPEEAAFLEHGFNFLAELGGGQKTGFYLDQRANRRRVEDLAKDRSVLDLFAHTGAFGLYALRGGARSVVHVESSRRQVDRGRVHYELNRELLGGDEPSVEWVAKDVFEDLRRRSDSYGMVICDPPPLARRRADRDKAARAYKDLNRLALGRVEPGGLFLTFCCSSAIDTRLFRQILFSSALEAGVDLALLSPLGAAPDHPVSVYHPEGEYLKGWLGVVRGAATPPLPDAKR
ncbi:MAG: class I SAM-dependent rRNA methyltransferase [Deltaproteobacteria bacterium]|nr:class I SAM-dependent rRNA methyltransferase [Deltaproteobacteria bacterium]